MGEFPLSLIADKSAFLISVTSPDGRFVYVNRAFEDGLGYAYALPGDCERFLDAGFNAYLAKPFVRQELYDALPICA